eukprot:gnl/MRDRNA2_/MRDRNA2_102829_c0_seq1.p1 gnl/MRDRNA2_/MRDRNA2_102829_c0~~gnl/MRDRNA2_/MRDRNA2_102829_c0_seq1.p1  ORF type:complete len:267 (-),score=50.16 gnl/MRDRNA2_/MRDRNA2_102829_c0_seq1:85-885(-)
MISCYHRHCALPFSRCLLRSGFQAVRAFNQAAQAPAFVFTKDNFKDPKLPAGLEIQDVPLTIATDESLKGFGRIVRDPSEFTVESKNFEIVPWPVQGWRSLDPGTGDEAGTTEGHFDVFWKGDFFYGHNLAIATDHNQYLDGLGAKPEDASHTEPVGDGHSIYLWMSDYHPDGAQLFWPLQPIPFVVCLGKAECGDDVTPGDMRAFYVEAGLGAYFHPGTWHNGVYVAPEHAPARFLTRQGKVHARVSASWAVEFKKLLRLPLKLS